MGREKTSDDEARGRLFRFRGPKSQRYPLYVRVCVRYFFPFPFLLGLISSSSLSSSPYAINSRSTNSSHSLTSSHLSPALERASHLSKASLESSNDVWGDKMVLDRSVRRFRWFICVCRRGGRELTIRQLPPPSLNRGETY
jgi:hypothetical protein